VLGITAGSREVPGRNACDRRHTYRIIIIIIIIIPDITIRDNEKGTCVLIDVAISEDRNVIINEAEKILKIQRPYNRNRAHVECKNKGDSSNNRGDWDCFRVIQKIREQHNGKT